MFVIVFRIQQLSTLLQNWRAHCFSISCCMVVYYLVEEFPNGDYFVITICHVIIMLRIFLQIYYDPAILSQIREFIDLICDSLTISQFSSSWQLVINGFIIEEIYFALVYYLVYRSVSDWQEFMWLVHTLATNLR